MSVDMLLIDNNIGTHLYDYKLNRNPPGPLAISNCSGYYRDSKLWSVKDSVPFLYNDQCDYSSGAIFQHHHYYVIIKTVIMQQLYMQVTCWVPGQWELREKGIKWQRNDTNETFYVCEFGLLKFSGYNGINKGLVNR